MEISFGNFKKFCTFKYQIGTEPFEKALSLTEFKQNHELNPLPHPVHPEYDVTLSISRKFNNPKEDFIETAINNLI